MTGSKRAAICGLLAGVLGWSVCATGLAQDGPVRPEVLPAPPASGIPRQDLPQPAYGPLQAGLDVYRMAEQQRLQAIELQLRLARSAWQYHLGPAPYYAPGVPHVYPYGSRRALRRAYRFGYWPAPQPWPNVSIGVYRYPYSSWVRQPTGYERIRIGPNSYVYRPYYGQPAGQQNPPRPVAPSTPTPAVAPPEQNSGPALNGPIRPVPEAIPAPPPEPGPG